jgi:hypothetical protein
MWQLSAFSTDLSGFGGIVSASNLEFHIEGSGH